MGLVISNTERDGNGKWKWKWRRLCKRGRWDGVMDMVMVMVRMEEGGGIRLLWRKGDSMGRRFRWDGMWLPCVCGREGSDSG